VRDGRIRQVRERAQLSQSEFGEALGVQPATISRWENGQRVPRGRVAERLTHLLRELEAASWAEPLQMHEAGFPASELRADENADGNATTTV
jgi:transcriptional regulator with XRE-family HTH domain